MDGKKKLWAALATMAAAVSVTLAVGMPALAADTQAAETAVVPDAQVPDNEGYTDGEASGSQTWESAGSRCKTVWARRTFKNWVGIWLWRYTQQISFCWNGSIVTNFYRERWPEVHNVLGFSPWSFDGHIGTNCQYEHCYPGRWGHWSETAWTQGKLSACVGPVCNYHYPLVTITVYGNGNWSWNTSG